MDEVALDGVALDDVTLDDVTLDTVALDDVALDDDVSVDGVGASSICFVMVIALEAGAARLAGTTARDPRLNLSSSRRAASSTNFFVPRISASSVVMGASL